MSSYVFKQPEVNESKATEGGRFDHIRRAVRNPATVAKGQSETLRTGTCGEDRDSTNYAVQLGIGNQPTAARFLSDPCQSLRNQGPNAHAGLLKKEFSRKSQFLGFFYLTSPKSWDMLLFRRSGPVLIANGPRRQIRNHEHFQPMLGLAGRFLFPSVSG